MQRRLLPIPLFVLLATIAPAAQEPQVSPNDPLHHFVELELGPEGSSVETTVDFEGTLFIWVSSKSCDPSLRVELARLEVPLTDEDSGGGTTALCMLDVHSGETVTLTATCEGEPNTQASAELHWIAAPETEGTREVADAARDEVKAVEQLRNAGSLEEARERAARLARNLVDVESGELSWLIPKMQYEVAFECYQLSLFQAADACWSAVLKARERLLPADHRSSLDAKQKLARTRSALGDLKGALELEEVVHAAQERLLSADHPDLLRTKQSLASARYEVGDYQGALELDEALHEALERTLPADHTRLLAAKLNLASTRSSVGNLPGALELEEAVLAAYERLFSADHPGLLSAKMNLSVTRLAMGDIEGAHALNEEVYAARERLLRADDPTLLRCKRNLAVTCKQLGDVQGALELEEAVFEAYKRLLPAGHPDILRIMGNLSATYELLGDIEAALALAETVYATSSTRLPTGHPDLATAMSNLAVMRSRLGDYQGAHELLETVHADRERILPPGHPDLLAAKLNLATAREFLGDTSGAHDLFEEVHSAREQLLPPGHPDLLLAQANLAVTRQAMGDLEGALELQEAVHAARERLLPPDHPHLLSIKLHLALTCWMLGDPQRANELNEEVHARRVQLFPEDHPDLLAARQNLINTRKAIGDIEGARELAASLLRSQVLVATKLHSEAPRVARARARREFFRFSSPLSWSDSAKATVEELALADLAPLSFSVLESLRVVSVSSPEVAQAASADPELAQLCESIARVRRELSRASSNPPEDTPALEAWRAQLFSLSEKRDALQSKLRENLTQHGLQFEPVTAEAVAAKLDPDSALVSFFRYERYSGVGDGVDSLLAFLVTPDKHVRRIELGPVAELEELASNWRAEIGAPVDRGVAIEISEDKFGATLRERLIDPCLAALGEKQPTTLHLVLDDFLHLLPFEALPWQEDRCLGQAITIRIENSTRALLDSSPRPAFTGVVLAFGDVNYDLGEVARDAGAATARNRASAPTRFERLLQTHFEVETLGALSELLRSEEPVLFTRDEATVQALIDNAPTARYLHIATHGWFAPPNFESTLDSAHEQWTGLSRAENTVRGFAPETLCGLALAGSNMSHEKGIITAEELSTLDLSNCELAVLSACETNVGLRRAGQGIQSLQTALHAAGARTAITSLWDVDDAATRRLMELFYTKLWSENLGKADALWQAKMALRNESHGPRDWAAWVLTGDPR